jgi:hypothetical protein
MKKKFVKFVLAVLVIRVMFDVVKFAFTHPIFLPGASAIVNLIPNDSRNQIIDSSKKLNELIDVVEQAENDVSKNPSKSREYVEQSLASRQRVAKIYKEMADTITKSKSAFANNVEHSQAAVEMVDGLQKLSQSATKANSRLFKFRPQDMGFFSLGLSELTNAMSVGSKEKLLIKTSELNKLIASTNTTNSVSQQMEITTYSIKESRQNIAKLHSELADILSDDLCSIQLNNPRIAPSARAVTKDLQNLATTSKDEKSNLSEFHPESIRY